MRTDTRLTRLERRRPAPTPEGGAVHTDAEHIADVLAALEAAGAIRAPWDLPEHEQAADVIRQIERIKSWNQNEI